MENASEIVQVVVLGACFALALVRALRMRNAAWIEVACFFACMFLGNVYWYGYLSVFGVTPRTSYISDLNWIGGYVFLLMLLVECDQQRGIAPPVRMAWVPVAACVACCVYYIWARGDIFLNLSENGLLAALGFFAARGLVANSDSSFDSGERRRKGFACNRLLHVAAIAFVVVEQALWLSSILDPTEGYAIYYTINYLLTFSYVSILASAWRSDDL